MPINREKVLVVSTLLLMGTFTSVSNAETVEDAYRKANGGTLLMLNDYMLRSGRYEIGSGDSDDAEIQNISVPGTYFFGEEGDDFRPYILGAVGYSHYERDDIRFDNGERGDIDNESLYLKAGGGIKYAINPELSILTGISATGLFANGGFDNDTPVSQKTKDLLQSDDTSWLVDLYSTLLVHPEPKEYKPYIAATLHYTSIYFDPESVNDMHGWSANLRGGFFTHELTRIWGMPVIEEVYANISVVDSDLSDMTGFDTSMTAGTEFYWKVGSLMPLPMLKELDVTFTLQGTVSNTDMSGYNIGFGLSLLKF